MDTETIIRRARILIQGYTPFEAKEYSDFSRTIEQLAALTVMEGDARGLDDAGLDQLWEHASSIILRIRKAIEPTTEAAVARWEKFGGGSFWIRFDPKNGFEDGESSRDYYEPFRNEIETAAGHYLQHPWLAHPTIDFAIVDALISCELCAFGKHVKDAPVFALLNNIIKSIAESRAKDSQLRLIWELIRVRAIGFFIIYVFPIAALGWYGIAKSKPWAVLVALGWLAFYIARKLWIFAVRLYRRFAKIDDPYTRAFQLWSKMYVTYLALAGNVLSATALLAQVKSNREVGAGWSQTIDVLIERRAKLSEGWVITPLTDGIVEAVLYKRESE